MNFKLGLIVLLLFALSAVGTLPSAYSVERGVDVQTWLIAAAAMGITSLGILWSGIRNDGAGAATRTTILIVLAWSLIAPYAGMSIHLRLQADVGLGCMGLCFLFFNAANGHWCRGLAYPLAFIAGLFNLSTLTLFAGSCRGVRQHTIHRSRGVNLFWCAWLGFTLALMAKLPLLLGFPFHGAPTGVHHDLWVLLPLIALGMAGLLAIWSETCEDDLGVDRRIPLWALLALVFLAVAYVGVPLDVRVSAYPLALLASRGLTDLARSVKGCVSQSVLTRAAASVSGVFLLVMAWLAAPEFASGPLLALHIFFS